MLVRVSSSGRYKESLGLLVVVYFVFFCVAAVSPPPPPTPQPLPPWVKMFIAVMHWHVL